MHAFACCCHYCDPGNVNANNDTCVAANGHTASLGPSTSPEGQVQTVWQVIPVQTLIREQGMLLTPGNAFVIRKPDDENGLRLNSLFIFLSGFLFLVGLMQEIVALSCSWCKSTYHNKENCFTMDRLTEMCKLGLHGDLIIPPSWIVKLPRKVSPSPILTDFLALTSSTHADFFVCDSFFFFFSVSVYALLPFLLP